jgi:hypothetical protein
MGLHSPRNPTSTEANSSTSGDHDGSGNRGPAPPGLTGVDAADAAVLALRQAVAAGLLLLSAQVRELVEAFTVSFACFGWQPPFCRCFCRDVVRLNGQSWPGCSFRYKSKSSGMERLGVSVRGRVGCRIMLCVRDRLITLRRWEWGA